jgi:hypothetical protein
VGKIKIKKKQEHLFKCAEAESKKRSRAENRYFVRKKEIIHLGIDIAYSASSLSMVSLTHVVPLISHVNACPHPI